MNNNVGSPDSKELKSFALTMMWAIPLLFVVIFPWAFNSVIRWESFAVPVVLGSLYLFYPKGIYPFYRIWMSITDVVGWINTRLLLAIVFFGMVLPIGFILRKFGKLHYQTKPTKNDSSYWIKNTNKLDKDDLERPF